MKNLIFIFVICLLGNYSLQSQCNEPLADSVAISENAQVVLSPSSELFINRGDKGFSLPLQKGSKQISLFNYAGLWIGGLDAAGNLKVAATFPHPENRKDFHQGPLDDAGQAYSTACEAFNRIFTVKGEEIRQHRDRFLKSKEKKTIFNCDSIPYNIKNWPAKGNPFFFKNIIPTGEAIPSIPRHSARFHDEDRNGLYDPCKGDFPIVFSNLVNNSWADLPEYINFWVFNDNAGLHRLTGGDQIQVQVNAYEYKYKSDGEANDVIYFSYEVINQADSDLTKVYIGLYLDPSMGCPNDDKVAFDTLGNTVVFYNGSKKDNAKNQCQNIGKTDYPYALALDYKSSLQSPKIFAKDSKGNRIYVNGYPVLKDVEDNDKIDTLINADAPSFVVFKDCPTFENVNNTSDRALYNLLRGKKINGEDRIYDSNIITKMFIGNPSESTSWSMVNDTTCENKDISCLLSLGPLLLQPGAINRCDFAMHLIPLKEDIPNFDVVNYYIEQADAKHYMAVHDDKGLGLRSAYINFQSIPEASKIEIEITEFERAEKLRERSFFIPRNPLNPTIINEEYYYKFEGYMLYQIKDLKGKFDDDNFKLIFQSDVENDIDRLYNTYPEIYSSDENRVNRKWQKKLMVSGNNKGIIRKYYADKDHFAKPGEDALIDGKTYHYALVTYNANKWKTTDVVNGYGQREEFWATNPRRYSYTFEKNKTSNQKLKHYCENGKLYLYNLQNNDHITVSSIDGKILYDTTFFYDTPEKVIDVPDQHSIIFVKKDNEVTQEKISLKVVCY